MTQRLEHRSFDKPDEVHEGHNWRFELVNLAEGVRVARITVHPGWKWSEHMKPAADTNLCTTSHQQYILAGRIRFVMEDGAAIEVGAGEVASVPPGHDAEVVGDEPVVAIDWQGAIVG